MHWNDLQAAAAVISSLCAIVAATVSVLVWRKSRSSDLAAKIDNGDKAARKHTDKSVTEMKAELMLMGKRMADIEDVTARIETSQQQHLTARDLGSVHEKINALAKEQAATSATTKAIHEQVRMIQNLLMRRDA